MLIGIGACALAFMMFCFGGPRPRKSPQAPATATVAGRTPRHQIHATREAPAYSSPWSRRVVIRGRR
jgi:hypothetical protein